MRGDYFEVGAAGDRIFINLFHVFRVSLTNTRATFYFLHEQEPSATYSLSPDKMAELIKRLSS